MARRGGAVIVSGGLDRTVTLDAFLRLVDCQASEREVRLVPNRRWRADVAWPAHHVALELQGGIYVAGHHVQGRGYEDDCAKILFATEAGWRVLPLTWRMIEREPATIAAALDSILMCDDSDHLGGGRHR
jgi:hypothetical protein